MVELPELSLAAVAAWENLLLAWRRAAAGKRGGRSAARFEHHIARRLLAVRDALLAERWRPGPYRHFLIHEPKRRLLSAAPFADRVVHHALCNIIEPHFEGRFVAQSYANRVGKGSHRAIDAAQCLSRRYRWVLRMDVVQHFPSIDHAILRRTLARVVRDPALLTLADRIIASGWSVGIAIGVRAGSASAPSTPVCRAGSTMFVMPIPGGCADGCWVGSTLLQLWWPHPCMSGAGTPDLSAR